ncbi:pro-FMRFamide-related neuropeptide FF isoform X2 [Carettochelys insculpta]|uniref:pro-FMRFamide-related neuropeptide FF isoform X2 n=1 Tax=Carettochelys insculpta TaxID=44489 RepID=UPI003EB914CD
MSNETHPNNGLQNANLEVNDDIHGNKSRRSGTVNMASSRESEDQAAWPFSEEHLLRSLFQALQRPSRSPSFLFQPQRFGRATRGSEGRLSQRGWDSMAPQFWSMAVPQRFGKKK